MNIPSSIVAATLALTACGSGITAAAKKPPIDTVPPLIRPAPSVHVSGNHLVDASGATIRLRGVNRSGMEFMCAQGRGIFDGPSDSISVRAIAQWRVNAVRVPAQRGVLARDQWRQPELRGHRVSAGGYRLRHHAQSLWHGRDRRVALERGWDRDPAQPAADAGSGSFGGVLATARDRVQGQQRGHLRSVQRALSRQ